MYLPIIGYNAEIDLIIIFSVTEKEYMVASL